PPVAAAIVEKITGQRFEDFVQQNLFLPIGMKTATYFEPPAASATTLYHEDGKTPYSYWHILLRPAGSINASANDMAAYVQFYLNRGTVMGKQLVPATDIDRMEIPQSTWAGKEGLKAVYGLSNYWSFHDGFAYHGHNGGVEGGLTVMSYMPGFGVGYFYSINSANGNAFEKIGNAIRAYLTVKLQKPELPPAGPMPANAQDYAGWYEPDSPRVELGHFIERILGISKVGFTDGKLAIKTINDWTSTFIPVSGMQFRYVSKKDLPEPVATVALLTPNPDGRYIQAGGGTTMKKIPGY